MHARHRLEEAGGVVTCGYYHMRLSRCRRHGGKTGLVGVYFLCSVSSPSRGCCAFRRCAPSVFRFLSWVELWRFSFLHVSLRSKEKKPFFIFFFARILREKNRLYSCAMRNDPNVTILGGAPFATVLWVWCLGIKRKKEKKRGNLARPFLFLQKRPCFSFSFFFFLFFLFSPSPPFRTRTGPTFFSGGPSEKAK